MKEYFVTKSYIGPELFNCFELGNLTLDQVDLYKNDVHSMGIVFLYIQVPEIKIKDINISIMHQTESGSDTYVFNVAGVKKLYNLTND